MGQPALYNPDGSEYTSPEPGSFQNASGGTSTSTSQKTYDPIEWAKLKGFGDVLIGQGGSIAGALQENLRLAVARQTAEKANQEAIVAASQAAGEVAAGKANLEAGNALLRKNILTAANINPEDVDNALFKTLQVINSNAASLDAMGREIDQRASVGVFDNPLGYWANQVRLPGLVGQYNVVANETNRHVETAKTLQALAGREIELSQNMHADEIKKLGVAEAAKAAAEATERLSKAQMDAAGATARDTANKLAMQGTAFQIQEKLLNTTAGREGESERSSLKDLEKLQLEQVNVKRAMIGAPDLTLPEFKIMSPAKRSKLIESSSKSVIAEKLSESVDLINSQGNVDRIANEGDSTAVEWIKATVRQARANEDIVLAGHNKTPGAPHLKENELQAMAIDDMQTRYILELNDMSTASKFNPAKLNFQFLAKNLKIVDGASGEANADGLPVAGAAVLAELNSIDPLTNKPVALAVTDKLLVDRFIAKTTEGLMTAGQAASQLSSFYKTAVVVQAERTKYPMFNIPYTGRYNIKVDDQFDAGEKYSFTGFTKSLKIPTIDLTNPAQLETYITSQVAARVARSAPMFEAAILSPAQ